MDLKFGLTLPHFGKVASRENILKIAEKAEDLGFNSVWARDHLVYHPHGLEDSDRSFIETFVTLAAVGTVTDLTLGTSVTFPHRHPLNLAQLYSSLEFMARGKVIAGIGMGSRKEEYDIAEISVEKREDIFKENIKIIKQSWRGEGKYEGDFYSFEDAFQYPSPIDIPVWGGGSAPIAVKRAWNCCDGWLPGRINMPSFRQGVKSLKKWSNEESKPMPTVGAIPIISIGRDRDQAIEKVNLKGLIKAAKPFWMKPESGVFETVEDLEGVLMAGGPEDIVREVEKFKNAGVNHLVFDMRQRFDDMEECMEIISDEVMPEFRK